ncbi:hypothetical protein IEQ34_012713 [Dendrobium chrysotoxum]|uniref:Uncharacterized protein n=1 Tax=Dendrobium chrysotoxum TaxID=161865 RepID=A0AAV7GPE3_DENCH|nr:hypothetical protein IEQ34_012713 [Dendrobium chrysotoxum]
MEICGSHPGLVLFKDIDAEAIKIYHLALKANGRGNDYRPDQDPMVPSSQFIMVSVFMGIWEAFLNIRGPLRLRFYVNTAIIEVNRSVALRPYPPTPSTSRRLTRAPRGELLCPWMVDPELDSGFVYDHEDFVDIQQSSFFDLNLEFDNSVEDYVNRILFQLSITTEERFSGHQWLIVHRPPTPPNPDNSLLTNILGAFCLLVASGSEEQNTKEYLMNMNKSNSLDNITLPEVFWKRVDVKITKRNDDDDDEENTNKANGQKQHTLIQVLMVRRRIETEEKLEGEVGQLQANVGSMNKRISVMEGRFENLKNMMKKIIEMQLKASPTIPRAEPKGKEILEEI